MNWNLCVYKKDLNLNFIWLNSNIFMIFFLKDSSIKASLIFFRHQIRQNSLISIIIPLHCVRKEKILIGFLFVKNVINNSLFFISGKPTLLLLHLCKSRNVFFIWRQSYHLVSTLFRTFKLQMEHWKTFFPSCSLLSHRNCRALEQGFPTFLEVC